MFKLDIYAMYIYVIKSASSILYKRKKEISIFSLRDNFLDK